MACSETIIVTLLSAACASFIFMTFAVIRVCCQWSALAKAERKSLRYQKAACHRARIGVEMLCERFGIDIDRDNATPDKPEITA